VSYFGAGPILRGIRRGDKEGEIRGPLGKACKKGTSRGKETLDLLGGKKLRGAFSLVGGSKKAQGSPHYISTGICDGKG